MLLIAGMSGSNNMFVNMMANVTVPTGREAVFTCTVDASNAFKVTFFLFHSKFPLFSWENKILKSSRS